MSGFQPLVGSKRPHPEEGESGRKKQVTANSTTSNGCDECQYWMVQWRNPQYRKHKTWDGDAVLVIEGTKAVLYELDGKQMALGRADLPIEEGKKFSLGGKELEIDRRMSKSEHFLGSFGSDASAVTTPLRYAKFFAPNRTFVPPQRKLWSHISPLETPDTKLGPPPTNLFPITKENLSSVTKSRSTGDSYWTVNWRKQQTKKNKTWDGDAYVSFVGTKVTMISDNGKILGVTTTKTPPPHPGLMLHIGNKEVELDCQITRAQLPMVTGSSKDDGLLDDESTSNVAPGGVTATSIKFVPPTSFYRPPPKSMQKGPRHDPEAEGAVVMKAPSQEHVRIQKKRNQPTVPVVIDPILARHLRPHQKEGVKFLYECVMGMRKHEGYGCILADEMGLGKTLQTISLVWTLLKQNPYAYSEPVVRNVLIVCPVSLINNWKAEFHKWLGKDRIGVVTCDKDKNSARTFAHMNSQQVLIIGYERLRTVVKDLVCCVPPIGLIICDEGHRLKSAKNKTVEALKQFKTPRRIILSGTPIQNDLSEFHAMADFCNPGLLDDYNTFRRAYEVPILRSRAPDCSAKESEVGEGRTAQLLAVAKSFVLRRDASILTNFLPPKHEYVVFVTPTDLQHAIFRKVLQPDKVDDLIQGPPAESLALINMLTKISSSPILLKATIDKAKIKSEKPSTAGLEEAVRLLPDRAQVEDMSLSGKLTALAALLKTIRLNTEEKVVLVSHYTSTLNILEAYCRKENYAYYRLDGQTPAPKRQEYVNAFNKGSQRNAFVFLLSSKAGGVGINLIGASRLCLVDSDWNPSHDLQSMARIHRDGQKRPVYIYRLLTAGTIDEKIYQRQITKLGLSSAMMGNASENSKSDSFSRKELRDIFRIYPYTACNTHDLLQCACGEFSPVVAEATVNSPQDVSGESESELATGFIQASHVNPGQLEKWDKKYLRAKKSELATLGEWKHINCLRAGAWADVQDDILRKILITDELLPKESSTSPGETQSQRFLSATDIAYTVSMDDDNPHCQICDFPGGTVSYLFQKSSIVNESEV